ncbi:MAG: FliA/WhiG family RNA polymerase sigma factor [Phycisphaerales bacterium]|nr:FliA/WhiG family RNA polymerase sigma factor [Phycisphaerales bacterium]
MPTSTTTAPEMIQAEAPKPATGPVMAAPPQRAPRRNGIEDTLDGRPIGDVWREYRDAPTEVMRNKLVEHYLPLVRSVAERLHSRLPNEVDVDDLSSSGLFGLLDAIAAYDPERGVRFETYCTQRVRGAIFDELRAMDWVPRLVRSRTSKVDRCRKELEMELGRAATDDEISARLGVDDAEYKKITRDAKPVGVVSMNRRWSSDGDGREGREVDVVRDTRQVNPVMKLQRDDLKHLLTKGLSRAERLIIVLYYYEEMTMKEIGVTLDLSESRVSQMHSSVLARLKAQMQHRTKDV